MAIKSKFIIFDTLTNFLSTNGIGGTAPSTDYIGNVPKGAVVFIKNTGLIWFNGNYFGPNITNYLNNYYTKTLIDNKLDRKQDEYYRQYLTFTALESGTFTFSTNALQYSLDNGVTWTTLAAGTATSTIAAGSKIMWKQTGLIPDSSNGIGKFSATGNFEVSGNIMSLLYGDDFIGQTSLLGKNYAFYNLFGGNTKLISAKNLVLPATTLAVSCYQYMFENCTSLTTAPELPATTLANYCYKGMFYGCSSLTTAPELPATTLANYCYKGMFYGCSSLTTISKLPATTLTSGCYVSMFQGCTSLTTAPELPATILPDYCYQRMFKGCTKLNYIKCLATDISASDCTNNWVQNVAATGTFITTNTPPVWTTGTSGIPSGWNVYTESEYKEVRHYLLDGTFSGKNYPVLLDSSTKKLYVNVPWTDSNTTSFTITANATDGLWDITGTNGTNAVTYAVGAYGSQQSKASFDTSSTAPTRSDRLNYNGYLYATKLFSGGVEVLTSHQSLSNYYTKTESDNKYVYKSGDTITGNLTVNGSTTLNKYINIYPYDSSYGSNPIQLYWNDVKHTIVGNTKLDGTNNTAVDFLHSGNSSVSKSGETLTVKINGTSLSLTNTNTWNKVSTSQDGYVASIGSGNADSYNKLTSSDQPVVLAFRKGVNGVTDAGWFRLPDNAFLNNTYDLSNYLPLSGGTLNNDAVISRTGTSVVWINGRRNPIIKTTSYTGYNAILSMKTTNGSWDLGVYSNDTAYLTYITDTNYSAGNNSTTYLLVFPKKSGTIATTSDLSSYLPLSGGTMKSDAYIGFDNDAAAFRMQIGADISTSPLRGITTPTVGGRWIGIFARPGKSTDEGGFLLSQEGAAIYNSFDSGFGFKVVDTDANLNDWNSADSVVFSVKNDNTVYSKGGFVKKDSSNSYVLLGGGGHKAVSDFATATALSGYLPLTGGTLTGNLEISASNWTTFKITRGNIGWSQFGIDPNGLYMYEYDNSNSLANYMYLKGGLGLTLTGHFLPNPSATYNLGSSSLKWNNLYLSNNLSDGTNSLTVANIKSTYDWYQTMTTGNTDGTINKWKEIESFVNGISDTSTLNGILLNYFCYRGTYNSTNIASSTPTQAELSDTSKLNGLYRVLYSGASGALLNFNGAGSTSYVLFYTTYNSGMLWRQSTDANYNAWRTILDSSNYTSYTYSKTDSDSRYLKKNSSSSASGDTGWGLYNFRKDISSTKNQGQEDNSVVDLLHMAQLRVMNASNVWCTTIGVKDGLGWIDCVGSGLGYGDLYLKPTNSGAAIVGNYNGMAYKFSKNSLTEKFIVFGNERVVGNSTITDNLIVKKSATLGGNGLQYPLLITRAYNDSVCFRIGSKGSGNDGLTMRIDNNGSGGGNLVYIDLKNGGAGVEIGPSLSVSGSVSATSFFKSGSSDLYVLLGGGGHKAISDFAISSHNHTFKLGSTTITTDGSQYTTINGPLAVATSASADNAFSIQRESASEGVKHWVDDGTYHIEYTNDEAANQIAFRFINTDTERSENKGADASDNTVYLDHLKNFYPSVDNTGSIGTSSNRWKNMYAVTFHGTATKAQLATRADRATNADSATRANTATNATNAARATHATNADSAECLIENNTLQFGKNRLLYFNEGMSSTGTASTNGGPTNNYYHIIRMNHGNEAGYLTDIACGINTHDMWYRRIVNGGVSSQGWTRVLDSTNTYINNGTITINGTSITPVTSLSGYATQSWANELYVKKAGDIMTGGLTFNRGIDGGFIFNKYNNTDYPVLRSHNNGNISLSASGSGLYIGYLNTSAIHFLTRDSIRMTIGVGNIGIGTASPSYNLHVIGSTYFNTNGLGAFIAKGTAGAYRDGIRIEPSSTGSNGWSILMLLGTDSALDSGTSANSWLVGSNAGNFYITRNGLNSSSSAILKCVSNQWSVSTSFSAVDFTATSDIRLKRDIQQISDHIYSFRFKDSDKLHYGFIALELEKNHPDLVGGGEYKTVNYNSALSLYVAELENRVKMLENEINNLKNK